MLREKLKKYGGLFISLGLAVVAGIIVYTILKVSLPSVTVVVAKHPISVGQTIHGSDLLQMKMPLSAVGTDAMRYEQIIGKTAAYPIPTGDIIRSIHLSNEGSLATILETYAPEGYVAVELPGNVAMGMQGLRRGDKVDVYGPMLDSTQKGAVPIVKGAIVLMTPWTNISDAKRDAVYVLAVPSAYAPALAACTVNSWNLTLTIGGNDNV